MPKDHLRDELIVLTTTEVDRVAAALARSSGKARARIVTGLLTQGLTPQQIADIQGRDVKDVQLECDDAVRAVVDQLEALPEGPILLAQVCLEGYALFTTRIMQAANECLDAARVGNSKDWTAASSLLRLSKETMDQQIEWMQRFGMVPNFSRGPGRPRKEADPEEQFALLVEKAGTTAEDIENDILASAVSPKPVKPEAIED